VKALLLSGGMDSVALAHWLRPDVAITVDYGQRAASAELAVSKHVCGLMTIEHIVLSVDCSAFGSGDMSRLPPLSEAPASDWWPFRNQLLATLAGMKAVSIGATELMLASVAADSVHVDGTPSFYEALNKVMGMQEGALTISAPALHMTTAELVRVSAIDRATLAWAHSCHTSSLACGDCRGCYKHQQVMDELYGDPY
jgi:7-cyano-7-deazaguanine synthase